MKNKKMTLTIGAISALIIPVAVISCAKKHGDKPKKGDGSTKEESSVKKNNSIYEAYKVTQPKIERDAIDSKLSQPAYTETDFSKADMQSIKDLRASRNSEKNVAWHTTGDNIVDTTNDIRYAVWKAASGDKEPAEKLASFINSIPQFKEEINAPQIGGPTILTPAKGSDNTTQYKSFSDGARGSMKNFLDTQDAKKLLLFYADSMNGVTHKRRDFSLWDLTKISPVQPGLREMAFAEYRTLQIEWYGKFDFHDFKSTNKKIRNNDRGGYAGIAKNPPKIWEDHFSSEDFGTMIPIVGKTNDTSEVSFEESWAVVFGFFLDDKDISGTLGQRASILDPGIHSIGWSTPVTYTWDANKNKNGYETDMILEFNGEFEKYQKLAKIVNVAEGNYKGITASSVMDAWTITPENKKAIIDSLDKDDETVFSVFKKAVSLFIGTFDWELKNTEENTYENIPNKLMEINNVNSIDKPTKIYDILGTGTSLYIKD